MMRAWATGLAVACAAVGSAAAGVEVERVFLPERLEAGQTNVEPVQPIDEAAWIWMEGETVWGAEAMAADAWNDPVPEACSRFFRFRRAFDSDGTPLRIDVSADERFVLLLDGKPVARGSHRGLVSHWYYQSYEIKGLRSGPHVLEAVCWQLGNHAPIAQLSWRGGFVLKAGGTYDARLTTGKAAWRVGRLVNTRMTDRGTSGTFGAGSQCEVNGTAFLAEEPAVWQDAVVVRPPVSFNKFGGRRNGWALFPTERPDPIFEPKTPGAVVNGQVDLTRPFVVPAGTKRDFWWDLGDHYCAYPELEVSGGKGATVSWGWTESLRDAKGRKGNRDDWRDKSFSQAFTDTFRADGREGAVFTTPWWRCGRWCRLTIETAAEPLAVKRVAIAETRYPLGVDFSFETDDRSIGDVVRICRRAVENCAHEMVFDCPYYEQQMYPGDTRIQLLIHDVLTRDDRLQRFALSVFDWDRRPDGLVPMNTPTRGTQESPTYTLCWAMMLRDYLLWHDDARFLRARLPGVRHSLMALATHEDGDGLLADLPGWNYMDSVWEWRTEKEIGVAPDCHRGERPGALTSLLYLHALRAVAEIEDALGETRFAAHWREKADRLAHSLVRLFWDEGRGALADDRARTRFSEHAQCLAILGGVFTPEQEGRAFAALTEGTGLVQATSYFSHYLFETYARRGRTDLILRRFDTWRNFLAHGAKTTFETPAVESRSDCHGWSACPIYFLATAFAGVKPAEPFFRSVRIAPQPATLGRIRTAVPSPKGVIRLDLRFADGQAGGSVELPAGLSGTFDFGGVKRELRTGANNF